MDPYIESTGSWPAFRSCFVAECARQLNQLLPRSYAARIDGRPQPHGLSDRVRWLDVPSEWFIHIQRRMVTGIEMLSPENKSG
jgi:hypothetical protein